MKGEVGSAREVAFIEDKQAVCVVLDTFEDERVVPRWSQCCLIFNISHWFIKMLTSHVLKFMSKGEIFQKWVGRRQGDEGHVY